MNRPRLIQWLRIAVSAICLAMFVGLIGLWVRSYKWQDRLEAPWFESGLIDVWSRQGQLTYLVRFQIPGDLKMTTYRVPKAETPVTPLQQWGWDANARHTVVYFPHCFPLLLLTAVGTIAAASWLRQLRWQFSLRALLIVTTLVAVVLGLIGWVVRGVG